MTTRAAPIAVPQRWYREPWPWLLMAGPAAVIVAGVITTYLAVVSSDGVVADDYYKRGLAINQTLTRDSTARDINARAQVDFAADFAQVNVAFSSNGPAQPQLVLRLAHPGKPALDRILPLTRQDNGLYLAAFPALSVGRWQVTLEDARQSWRLTGEMLIPGRAMVALVPR